MATSDIKITPGTGSNVATYSVTEDAETKQIGRATLNTSAGTELDMNSGNKSAATMRVVLATDQPALTNKILTTPDLPSGASTAAKQPALGTAGTASADVISIQGIASMTPVKTDGSATTQPVSGTVASTQSGIWTVQPGNTANTTAWLVKGSGIAKDTQQTEIADGSPVVRSLDRYGRTQTVRPILTQASSNGTPITTATNTILVAAPAANSHIRIHRVHLTSLGTATTCYLRDGTGGTKLYPVNLAVAGQTVAFSLNGCFKTTGGGTPNALVLNTSAACSVEWTVDYETAGD